jgi:hypothetical protein
MTKSPAPKRNSLTPYNGKITDFPSQESGFFTKRLNLVMNTVVIDVLFCAKFFFSANVTTNKLHTAALYVFIFVILLLLPGSRSCPQRTRNLDRDTARSRKSPPETFR